MRLCDELQKYGDSDFYPFHMPGHKRNPEFLNELYNSAGNLVDITEIDGFDNLHNAQGLIEEEQKRAAEIFGSEKSFLLVNGSSCGLIASIAALVPLGGKVIVAKNCHKSVFNGLTLREANIVYITPEERNYPDFNIKLTGAVSAIDIAAALEDHKDAKVVIVTSPTYEGISSDLKSIAEVCHKANVPLIVDAAHGAHFKFHEEFPQNAVESGADVVVHSLHKTLPSLTSTGLLHVNGELVDITQIQYYLQVFQTSSPSYILMSSISSCLKYLESDKSKEDFDIYVNRLKDIYRDSKHILPSDNRDISKLLLIPPKGVSGVDLSDFLRKEHHIELEMAQPGYALAMTSVCDTKEGFDRLLSALTKVQDNLTLDTENAKNNQCFDRKWIGMKSPVALVPYPPGIPLVQKDEVIQEDHAFQIEKLISEGIQIEGLNALTNC